MHEGMKAQIRQRGELLEKKIDVENVLRQRCTLAPPYSMYTHAYIVAERWKKKTADIDGVGVCVCQDDDVGIQYQPI